jgi:hypothetical protein
MKVKIPKRSPKYNFGDVLVSRNGFRGRVNMMFADFNAVLDSEVVSRKWFEIQTLPPSTKDQVFYHLVGDGAVLAGELDVYPAMATAARSWIQGKRSFTNVKISANRQ